MLTRLSRPEGHVSGLTGTVSLYSFRATELTTYVSTSFVRTACLKKNSRLGLGLEKRMFEGMVLFSKASTPLITLVRPDAPSECPTLGFTYAPRQKSGKFQKGFDQIPG